MYMVETKIFYTFQDLADKFGVSVSHLRYYAEEFSITGKKRGKILYFSQREVNKFGKILKLIQEEKYTVEGAKKQLAQREEVFNKKSEAIKRLENIKEVLLMMKERFS